MDISFSNREGDAVSRITPAKRHGINFRRFRSENKKILAQQSSIIGDNNHVAKKFGDKFLSLPPFFIRKLFYQS